MDCYLNTENLARSNANVEWHPLRPCIDEETRVLFLGSFPPQRKRWAKGFNFFYPNFINDHWRIMGLIFYANRDRFVDAAAKTYNYAAIINFVRQNHLGYYDTSEAVRRLQDNASDKFLHTVEPTDVRALASKAPKLRMIITTGQKAAETLCEYFSLNRLPKVGESIRINSLTNAEGLPVSLHRLPSSSRAYPMALHNKADYYRNALAEAGILTD